MIKKEEEEDRSTAVMTTKYFSSKDPKPKMWIGLEYHEHRKRLLKELFELARSEVKQEPLESRLQQLRHDLQELKEEAESIPVRMIDGTTRDYSFSGFRIADEVDATQGCDVEELRAVSVMLTSDPDTAVGCVSVDGPMLAGHKELVHHICSHAYTVRFERSCTEDQILEALASSAGPFLHTLRMKASRMAAVEKYRALSPQCLIRSLCNSCERKCSLVNHLETSGLFRSPR